MSFKQLDFNILNLIFIYFIHFENEKYIYFSFSEFCSNRQNLFGRNNETDRLGNNSEFVCLSLFLSLLHVAPGGPQRSCFIMLCPWCWNIRTQSPFMQCPKSLAILRLSVQILNVQCVKCMWSVITGINPTMEKWSPKHVHMFSAWHNMLMPVSGTTAIGCLSRRKLFSFLRIFNFFSSQLYSGPERSMHSSLRKHMQIDKTQAN